MKRTAFFRFLRRKQFISWSAKTACRILHLQMIRIACVASRWVKLCFTNPFFSHPFSLLHFFSIQHPRQTKKIPTRYTHFGIRHARSIPTPTAIRISPHNHSVGAPLHLLRIPSPPFFYFYANSKKLCKQKRVQKDSFLISWFNYI